MDRYFKAEIDKVDNDYRAWCGTITIKVNSWDEAEIYCKENSWSGISYHLDFLVCGDTGKVLNSEKEYQRFIERSDG